MKVIFIFVVGLGLSTTGQAWSSWKDCIESLPGKLDLHVMKIHSVTLDESLDQAQYEVKWYDNGDTILVAYGAHPNLVTCLSLAKYLDRLDQLSRISGDFSKYFRQAALGNPIAIFILSGFKLSALRDMGEFRYEILADEVAKKIGISKGDLTSEGEFESTLTEHTRRQKEIHYKSVPWKFFRVFQDFPERLSTMGEADIVPFKKVSVEEVAQLLGLFRMFLCFDDCSCELSFMDATRKLEELKMRFFESRGI